MARRPEIDTPDAEERLALLIRIWVSRTEPLAGTAATKASEPLHFDGWLGLLRVVSELVAGAPSSEGEDADSIPDQRPQAVEQQFTRLHATRVTAPRPASPGDTHPAGRN